MKDKIMYVLAFWGLLSSIVLIIFIQIGMIEFSTLTLEIITYTIAIVLLMTSGALIFFAQRIGKSDKSEVTESPS